MSDRTRGAPKHEKPRITPRHRLLGYELDWKIEIERVDPH
jgi:hypothetical protein